MNPSTSSQTPNPVPNPAQKVSFFDTTLFKIGLIGFLTLLLLIPSALIQDLILERQNRQSEVTQEIADKWSGNQELAGPVLVLPYSQTVKSMASGKEVVEQLSTQIYILPEKLKIQSTVEPELLHRGIFDAVVYTSKINVTGNFSPLELTKSGINPALVDWKNAKMVIGLTDLKGLKNSPKVKIGEKTYEVEPEFSGIQLFLNNLSINPEIEQTKQANFAFQFQLDLRGSTSLNFMHLGKETDVQIKGNWGNPSFTGRYLPDERKVSDSQFEAQWKLPYFNRTIPQQWVEQSASLVSSVESQQKGEKSKVEATTVFGVKFLPAVDQYQQTLRTAKYSFLIILLSFISLFFTEILLKKKVHIIQYILIGAAMTVYYSLLLAFSEQIGFDLAYLVASISTILLISTFLYMLFKSTKPALLFAAILGVFYLFIYTIIQLQDMAVLVGSIGLFVTVAVLMYLSAKQDWFKS